jgi:hypothetical protein
VVDKVTSSFHKYFSPYYSYDTMVEDNWHHFIDLDYFDYNLGPYSHSLLTPTQKYFYQTSLPMLIMISILLNSGYSLNISHNALQKLWFFSYASWDNGGGCPMFQQSSKNVIYSFLVNGLVMIVVYLSTMKQQFYRWTLVLQTTNHTTSLSV